MSLLFTKTEDKNTNAIRKTDLICYLLQYCPTDKPIIVQGHTIRRVAIDDKVVWECSDDK